MRADKYTTQSHRHSNYQGRLKIKYFKMWLHIFEANSFEDFFWAILFLLKLNLIEKDAFKYRSSNQFVCSKIFFLRPVTKLRLGLSRSHRQLVIHLFRVYFDDVIICNTIVTFYTRRIRHHQIWNDSFLNKFNTRIIFN